MFVICPQNRGGGIFPQEVKQISQMPEGWGIAFGEQAPTLPLGVQVWGWRLVFLEGRDVDDRIGVDSRQDPGFQWFRSWSFFTS